MNNTLIVRRWEQTPRLGSDLPDIIRTHHWWAQWLDLDKEGLTAYALMYEIVAIITREEYDDQQAAMFSDDSCHSPVAIIDCLLCGDGDFGV